MRTGAAHHKFMRRVTPRFPIITLWWLRPVPLLLFMVVPVYLSYLGFNFENWVPRRYVPSLDYLWGLALLLILALGALLTSAGAGRTPAADPHRLTPLRVDVPGWYMAVLFCAAVLAYVLWFGPMLSSTDRIVAMFSGERGNLRDATETQPGITTLTQCGVAFIVLYVIKQHAGVHPPARWETAALVALFGLTVMRAVLWSERLAVIEAAAAYGVTAAAFLRLRSADQRRLAALLPFIGPVLLYLAFTTTEYFRSWAFYKDYYDSVWTFAFERLSAYYALATNSGIGLLQETRDWPGYTGRYVLEWLYRMPVLGEILLEMVGTDPRTAYHTFLELHGRLEFNNPTGIFVTVFDIGYTGSALYFFCIGALVGALWKSWYRHRLAGLFFYPFCFLFMLELLRFNYFAASRFVPIVASLLVAGVLLTLPQRARRATPTKSPAQAHHHASTVERYS
jgi:hypothetical protein